MKKYMLCIASYNDYRQEYYEKYIKPNNLRYCSKHDIEYIDFTEDIYPIRDNYIWVKSFKIAELLKDLDENDILISIDADIAIFNNNIEFNIEEKKSFAYSIDTANTHNMGFHIIRNNEFSKNLIKELISEDRYNKNINDSKIIHKSESTSLFWKLFADQASWYSLAGIKRHSDIPFWDIDNFGWHSDINEDTFFTKSQLYDNVQLLSSNFNVTELKGETEGTYNINKVRYYNVINRHFAGGQKFKKVWYKNNLILLHIYFWNPIRIISILYSNYFYRLVGKIKSMTNKNSI